MPAPGSPAARLRLLAAELRRLRLRTGQTADEAGGRLGWSKAKVSRYELAQSALKPADVAALLELYDVEEGQRERLLALAEDAIQKGWWEAYSDVLTDGHMTFIGLEAGATSITEWHVSVVPGLLQTEHYALDVLSGSREVAPASPRAVQRRLDARITRQQVLARADPLDYTALLDESVLLRQRGGRPVMHGQLLRLAELSEKPNVTIRVLPLQRDHGLAVDSFAILQFGAAREAALHDMVSIEHLGNELIIEGDPDVHAFRLAFGHLAAQCLPPGESRDLILATARQVWGEA